jgi:hypothetical protein
MTTQYPEFIQQLLTTKGSTSIVLVADSAHSSKSSHSGNVEQIPALTRCPKPATRKNASLLRRKRVPSPPRATESRWASIPVTMKLFAQTGTSLITCDKSPVKPRRHCHPRTSSVDHSNSDSQVTHQSSPAPALWRKPSIWDTNADDENKKLRSRLVDVSPVMPRRTSLSDIDQDSVVQKLLSPQA